MLYWIKQERALEAFLKDSLWITDAEQMDYEMFFALSLNHIKYFLMCYLFNINKWTKNLMIQW